MSTLNPWRRALILLLPGLALLVASTTSPADEARWQQLRAVYFQDRPIGDAEGIIALEAPTRAHDAAIVPIVVRAYRDGSDIRSVHLIVDKNPLPLAGIFRFEEQAAGWESFETRIRINEYTTVRAIAELTDGSLHMASQFVKAAGGCSAPALGDLETAMARAGKMKLLLDEINQESTLAEASIRISHPNNSGMQFDQISRNYIPAFYVDSITAELDGKPLLTVETNFSMSENPGIDLRFPASSQMRQSEMRVIARDSKGNAYEGLVSVR